MEHVRELRGRLLWTFAVFLVGAVIGYLIRSEVIGYLQRPLHEALYYTTPTGSFEFVMKVCGIVGLIAALPVLVFNFLRFIEPALPRRLTKRMMVAAVSLSYALAIGGAAFAYYISLPAALNFFATVSASSLKPLIGADQYFRFVFAYLATFSVVFQLPLLLFITDNITPLRPDMLRKARKWVVAGAFGVALLTPAPDPLSQAILAVPIIVLYEASVIVIRLRATRRARLRRATEKTAVAAPVPAQAAAPTPAKPLKPRPVHATRAMPRNRVAAKSLDLRGGQVTPPAPQHVLDLRKLAS
jgi:sec-independent protein translocase protein TatC